MSAFSLGNLGAVALGGGIGAMLRYGLGIWAGRLLGPGFPWGTLTANILGGVAIGVIVEWLALRTHLPPAVRWVLVTGLLGGFTTFSAFSLETVTMFARNAWLTAGGYVLASVALSIGGVYAGLALARSLLS